MTAHHGRAAICTANRERSAASTPGRAAYPTIKVRDLAWLEFQKPGLAGSERFAHAFGFTHGESDGG